jgi:hypothetical protein
MIVDGVETADEPIQAAGEAKTAVDEGTKGRRSWSRESVSV